MATKITTQSFESKTTVYRNIEIFDFFFVGTYTFFSYSLTLIVHERLRLLFMIFSILMAVFLTSKSSFNKNRRNFESLYFLLTKDESTYRPFRMREEHEKEK